MNTAATATPPTQTSTSIAVTSVTARPSAVGAPDWFTGTVVVDPLFPPNAHSAASGGLVTFTPGARTAWHAHPVGQVLVVTSGQGWLQAWGGERHTLRAGDVAWIPPGSNTGTAQPSPTPCRTSPFRKSATDRRPIGWSTSMMGSTEPDAHLDAP